MKNNIQMNIIVQTYSEKNPERAAEYETCLLNNLNHFNVKMVHNLYESEETICESVQNHPKYCGVQWGKRMTYADAFEYAETHIPVDEIVGVINLDIYIALAFDYPQMTSVLCTKNHFLALSRHEHGAEIRMDPAFAGILHSNTQDGWFFKNPVLQGDYNIELGRLGCDNAIAKKLKNAGYIVLNIPERFVIVHIDKVRGKTGTNFMEHHKDDVVIYNDGWLVPNYDAIKYSSADTLMNEMKFNETERVLILSEIFNYRIKLNNKPGANGNNKI